MHGKIVGHHVDHPPAQRVDIGKLDLVLLSKVDKFSQGEVNSAVATRNTKGVNPVIIEVGENGPDV